MTPDTQPDYIEIQVYGMVGLENGEAGLGAAQVPERDPEYYDIEVRLVWTETGEVEILLERDGLDNPQAEAWVERFEKIFPEADVSYV